VPSLRLVLAVPILLAALLPAAAAASARLLENGGFELGRSGWSGPGISASGCDPRSGSGALQLATSGAAVHAQQAVAGPLGDGVYALGGYAYAASGSPRAEALLTWLDAGGDEISRAYANVPTGAAYASFGLSAPSPAGAAGLRVRISVDSSQPAALCLDDLRLDGPSPPVPTATPTPTTTSTPAPTLTPRPSVTTASAAKLAATADPTATTKDTATTGYAAPSFAFVNGGFEQGLTGWRKHGGELRLSSPAYAGATAGELTSTTDSTKWAYQTVRIEASQTYEFSGYLRAGLGDPTAYLRISWYASDDGSGKALATTDSTAVLKGAAGGWTYLTTGAAAPPSGAASAKPRVVLTPTGATPAAVYFDELAFQPAALPAPTATPEPKTLAPSDEAPAPTAQPASAPPTVSSADRADAASPIPRPSPTPLREVSAVLAQVPPSDEDEELPSLTRSASTDGGVPLVWLAGGGLFAAALGGSYLTHRRRE
jgi:hypothetical protein